MLQKQQKHLEKQWKCVRTEMDKQPKCKHVHKHIAKQYVKTDDKAICHIYDIQKNDPKFGHRQNVFL